MSNQVPVPEGILAKNALAQRNTYPLGSGVMRAIEPVFERQEMETRTIVPALGHIVGGALWIAAIGNSLYAQPSYFDDVCHFKAVCYRQSDSQQLSPRAQRARSVRTVIQQSEENAVIRAMNVETPFPDDENSYNPRIPGTPRILRLLK